MIFEVETGSGSPTANSYASVEFANQYIQLFHDNNESWVNMSDQQKEALLVYSTKFVDSLLRWESELKNDEQALAFPRKDFRDADGRKVSEESVPPILVEIVVDFAIEHLVNGLSNDFYKLIREDFGDTSDTYSSPKLIKSSDVVYDTRLELIHKGYGTNRSSLANIWRS